jgi:hypothetical protein
MSTSLAQGAREHLVQYAPLRSLLGSGKGFPTWIFRGQDDQSKPYVNMEGTGQAALLLRQDGGWTTPNRHNTMSFPRLVVECYIDPERDAVGNEIGPDVMSRFQAIWTMVDRYLRNVDHSVVMWGDIRTLGCDRLDEWSVFALPDGGGIRVSRAGFGVTLG